jgi:glucose/arabinose dehydrogenase
MRWKMKPFIPFISAVIVLLGCSPAPPELIVTDHITGLDKPWDVTWTPGGEMLFTENNTGNVWAGAGGIASPIHNVSDLDSSGEGGLMGIALSPNFSANRHVFLCYTSDSPDVRIVRYRTDTGLTGLFEKTPIVTGGPYTTGRHSGCRIKFGPAGYLWATFGDAAVGTSPQDDNSLGGKILRVDADGNAAPDNPGGNIWFAKGYRNPQGIDFRPSDGLACIAQHGPFIDDELECLDTNCFNDACNSGWNPVPGYNETVPMTDLFAYPDANEAIWSSGSPTLAPSGMSFLEGTQWGAWNQAMVVAFLKTRQLGFFRLDAFNALQAAAFSPFSNRLRTAEQGPDGCLYILEDVGSSGRILKACPAG